MREVTCKLYISTMWFFMSRDKNVNEEEGRSLLSSQGSFPGHVNDYWANVCLRMDISAEVSPETGGKITWTRSYCLFDVSGNIWGIILPNSGTSTAIE